MSEVDRWYPNAYGEMQDYPTGEYVLASDYDALRARLAEAEEIISTAARYWSVPGSSAYERKLLANAVAWIARGSVNGEQSHG